jgi:integrase
MRGTIISRIGKDGKKSWGYSFFVGRDEGGKRIQKVKRGFARKGEAEEALRAAIEGQGKAPQRAMPTFKEFFLRWHREIVQRECQPKTAESYTQVSAYAIRLFGDVPLDQLTPEQLSADMNRLADHGGRPDEEHPQGKPLSPKSIRHIAFLVQLCLKQAVDWDLIAKNPMLKVRKPKTSRRRPAVVDRAGLERLLRHTAGTRLYPIIAVASATGMRRGELLAVKWTDLNWDQGTLEVSKSLGEGKKGLYVKSTKSGETRRFSLPDEILEVLREHQRHQQEDRVLHGPAYAAHNLIFPRHDGEYYTPKRLASRITQAMRAVGLHGVSLHSLRHSHASQLLSDGVPITAVAERLGHASPNITLRIYSHALPLDNVTAARVWNDAMADVIRESRKEAVRKRMLSNVINGKAKKTIIPIESAS